MNRKAGVPPAFFFAQQHTLQHINPLQIHRSPLCIGVYAFCFPPNSHAVYDAAMRKNTALITILILVGVCAVVWYAVWRKSDTALTVSFLDVGQGDAIFIETPSGQQMLIDGGSNRAVLRQLSRIMPWYDRTIDVVVATHPDQDHIGGLIDVLERYRVRTIVESGVGDNGGDATAFKETVARETATRLEARRGEILDLGDGVRFEILFPDRHLPLVETNTASIIGRLVYGSTAFMLTGDAPQATEEYVTQLDMGYMRASVLKVGHHGSHTSSSPLFVGFVDPQYAVFSRGCDNRYGHPHADVVALFKKMEIATFDTCTDGTITFVSDGQTVQLR